MPDRMIADCAPAHRSKTRPESPTTDTQLDSAVAVAGEHPERATELAEQLSIGTGARESMLHQALRGEALPPPIHDEWVDPPHAGAFDAGVARVLGEEYVVDFEAWVRANKYPMHSTFRDVVTEIREEVKQSYGFARYALMLAGDIRMALDDKTPETEMQSTAEKDLSNMAAVAFYAGWIMGQEHQDAKRSARAAKGTVQELVSLLLYRLHPGAASPDTWTSRGYWTEEQVWAALDRVRAIEAPEEHAELQAAEQGGAR